MQRWPHNPVIVGRKFVPFLTDTIFYTTRVTHVINAVTVPKLSLVCHTAQYYGGGLFDVS